ncbi:TPA: JAB domain-containing protein [Clostridioides difficile]
MKNNLYKEFNCNSKEELYEKIKNRDDEIRPLIEFLDYARANIKNSRQAINSPDTFVEYVKSTTLPTKDTGTIIFANTKNHPVHLKRTRLSWKNSIKEALREGLMAGANSVFLAFSNDTPNKRIEETKEYFEKIGMKIIDTIGYNKENNSFISKVAGRSYYSTKTYEIASDSENAYGEKDYSLKDKYEDFTSYFASNELIDLNVVENVEEIKEVLKIGFQHHQQEIFGVLIYDSNEKIIGAEELFKGATDAAIVDLKIIARTLFNYQDVKGMAVFHNHPSGNPTPSREDIEMTKKIKNVTEIFEIELLDHFIIGKEKTLSFSQEVSGFQSENLSYQDKLGQMSIVKEDKNIYDREKVTLEVGDKIKTALSDETIVLDIDKDNAILFDGRQFVEVYGLQSDNGKFFWNHGNYSDSYPQKKDSQIIDTINKMIDEDYEGFVKALITIETGIDNPDLLDELYDRFMHNDGVNLINDYFDEVIYDLEYDIITGKEKDIEPVEISTKENELFSKMDGFINSYTELSNAMYDADYDFADSYPLEKSFHDIDFIGWVEATKTNLFKTEKEMDEGRFGKEYKKESTIAKLNKLKDKVAKDSIGKPQEKVENNKNDREM